MILLIDAGNTRLKWAWRTGTETTPQRAVSHREETPEAWMRAMSESRPESSHEPVASHEAVSSYEPGSSREPGSPREPASSRARGSSPPPSRVFVSNVAGAQMAQTLSQWSRDVLRVEPTFVATAATFEGLTNGYLDVRLLGVDRWMAMIGARSLARTAVCVIDAGTALKVDGIDGNGHHLGGLIVPGLQMMRDGLMSGTSDIARAAATSPSSQTGVFANNTVAAISRGTGLALTALVDRAVDLIADSMGSAPRLLLTGGDAEVLARQIRAPGEIVPDLVLKGLAAIAAVETPAVEHES